MRRRAFITLLGGAAAAWPEHPDDRGQWDNRLSLDRDLVLPDFGDPVKKVWPPHEVPLAAQLAQAYR